MRSSSARTSRLLSARLAGFHSRLKFLVVRAILSFAPFSGISVNSPEVLWFELRIIGKDLLM